MSEPTKEEIERDRRAEEWLMKRHNRDWYIGEATAKEWREAYAAVGGSPLLAVTCPTCGAVPGEGCRVPRGRISPLEGTGIVNGVHPERIAGVKND